MFSKVIKNKKGTMLVSFVILLSILTSILLAVASVSLANKISIERTYKRTVALNIAEGGAEKAIWEIKQGGSYTGETGNTSIAGGEFDVVVSDIDATNKYITSVAYVPSKANPKYKKAVKVKLSAKPSNTDITFGYAIQAGIGGANVVGSSEVEGSIYSNGDVNVSGSAKVKDPGNVWAVGTITDNGRIEGTKTPGAPEVPLPTIDFDAWRALAQAGGTITGDYNIPPGDIGPVEITGNATFSGSKNVNIKGPIYIHGSLNISGSGDWILDNSLGADGTMIIVDGSVSISGSIKFKDNSAGGYLVFAVTSGSSQISYTGSAKGEKLALFAPDGTVNFSGSGEIVAMTGKTININGSGEIEYEEGIPVVKFPGAPGGSWTVEEWQEISPP